MKNLKDYFKMIFTAVVCFVMSFVQRKEVSGKTLTKVRGNNNRNNGKEKRKVYGLKDVLTVIGKSRYRIEEYNLFFEKEDNSGWKVHWHKPCIVRIINSPAYYNTG